MSKMKNISEMFCSVEVDMNHVLYIWDDCNADQILDLKHFILKRCLIFIEFP